MNKPYVYCETLTVERHRLKAEPNQTPKDYFGDTQLEQDGVDRDSWLRFVANHGQVALRFAAYRCYNTTHVRGLFARRGISRQ